MFRLGQGKTSSSYKALDLDLQVPVVLKVIRHEFLEDEEARKRFLREARAAALLRHPNVAMIYRLGEEDGTCFYAREFIEGETLDAKVNRDGPLTVTEALNIALQVAQALVAVKKMNLVHRDIKPSNLMIAEDGAIKIIDFGLTKSNPNGQGERLELITLSGFVGTPDYASPEQLNEQTVDVASDIYSLGVTLWFLLTGRQPFRGPMAQVMAKHLQSPPPFDELQGLPRSVVSLLAHMLEKDPAKRPISPAHLVEEIEKCVAAVKGEVPPIAPINLIDQRRPQMRTLAQELGCHYRDRPDNRDAKAGNMNAALPSSRGELIAVFDADFIPTQDFLERTVGFFSDSKVGLVQTPQNFYSVDAVSRNLGLPGIITEEQQVFFRAAQPGRDTFGATLCHGTSFVVRRKAVEEIGGFPGETLSEDWATSIKLQSRGHKCYYLNELLSAGAAAEFTSEFVGQRLRWARGTLQSFFASTNPITVPGLTLAQRLIHLCGPMHYLPFVSRFFCLLLPLLYFFFGIVPLTHFGRAAARFLPAVLGMPGALAFLADRRTSLGVLVGGVRDDALLSDDADGDRHAVKAVWQTIQGIQKRRHANAAHAECICWSAANRAARALCASGDQCCCRSGVVSEQRHLRARDRLVGVFDDAALAELAGVVRRAAANDFHPV